MDPATVNVSMLEALLDSAVGAIILIDANGIIQKTNPATEKLFGYTEAELTGKSVNILMPEPYKSEHDGYLKNYLNTGTKKIIGIGREAVGRKKNGTTFPIHLSVGEFHSNNQQYFTGIVHDLTEQKKAEALTTRLGWIIEDSINEIYVFDTKTLLFEQVNRGARENLGYDMTELRALTPVDLKPEYSTDQFAKLIQPLKTGEKDLIKFRTVHKRKDDSLYDVDVHLYLSRALDPPAFIAIILDITELLQKEEQLQRSARLEAIGQLTGGIAHDFNNLLTVVIGNIELIEMKLHDENLTVLLNEAQEAAEMGARLTDRLLTFARRRYLEPKTINMNDIVLGLSEMLRRTLGEPINLSTLVAGDLWLTRIDPGQLENAILNLAINARDAMPAGGRLIIETKNARLDDSYTDIEPGLKAGDYVLLSVSDTGQGMPPEVLERAFEPFFTTKEAGGGNGLGLSMIYGFVKQSGGHATIYSEVDEGTTVNLYLPKEQTHAKTPRPSDKAAVPAASLGEQILVVEDDERIRRLTVGRLRELGYEVLDAENAQEALKILKQTSSIDLLFTDLVMPGGMSGHELSEKVTELYPNIKILLTSGFTEDLVNDNRSDDQIFEILRKPYRQADLAIKLREVLTKQTPPK